MAPGFSPSNAAGCMHRRQAGGPGSVNVGARRIPYGGARGAVSEDETKRQDGDAE
jgi:hypothetical protein